MKNRWFLCLLLFVFLCLQLESFGLTASAPRIWSIPANGSVFHGERNVTPGYGQVVREEWTPHKPGDYYYVKIGIAATGYGEVAFTLNGDTKDENIGNWTSEPLTKGDGPFTFRKIHYTDIINEAREGFADEIRPTTVSMSATGSAQTRSRQITTYRSRQAALTAQANATGPGVGFVIGESTYWKWEAGITRNVSADAYSGEYRVTINDTNIDPGSGSGDNTPNCPDCITHCSSPCRCTNSGTCDGSTSPTPPPGNTPPTNPSPSPTPPSPSYHPCGVHLTSVTGNHSLQASCSSSNSNGNCTVTSFYACDNHTHSYPSPPTPPPSNCPASAWIPSCNGRTNHTTNCSHGNHTYYSCSAPSNVRWHTSGRCSPPPSNCPASSWTNCGGATNHSETCRNNHTFYTCGRATNVTWHRSGRCGR